MPGPLGVVVRGDGHGGSGSLDSLVKVDACTRDTEPDPQRVGEIGQSSTGRPGVFGGAALMAAPVVSMALSRSAMRPDSPYRTWKATPRFDMYAARGRDGRRLFLQVATG